MKFEDLKRLVVFCILMETHQGIVGKAPTYIIEKWNAVNITAPEHLEALLDKNNKEKYREWLKTWIEMEEPP